MRFFEQSVETMPREALELLQIEKLYSMLEKIYGSNRFYTGKLEAAGIHPEAIQTLSDLASLPLTTKAELVQAQEDALPFGTNATFPESAYSRFHQTSGTTATPPASYRHSGKLGLVGTLLGLCFGRSRFDGK